MSTTHAGEFELSLERQSGYAFEITFDKDQYPKLRVDEPAPLGEDSGPNPSRLLAASVASFTRALSLETSGVVTNSPQVGTCTGSVTVSHT